LKNLKGRQCEGKLDLNQTGGWDCRADWWGSLYRPVASCCEQENDVTDYKTEPNICTGWQTISLLLLIFLPYI
jgi:hypothetical protein